MKITFLVKLLLFVILGILTVSACGESIEAISTKEIPSLVHAPTNTPVPTSSPTVFPSVTATPISVDRPVFLAWPLPAYVGTARISQYPNTPWTWKYLGLNEGFQCPPMFGYLLNLDSLPYWRDFSIPEEQDKAQADPHQFEMVECYSTDGNAGANGHEGTDIKAPAGTPVLAVAGGKIQEWRLTDLNSMVVLKHCLGGTWDVTHQCIGGKQWYTTYMHIIPDKTLLQENRDIVQGQQLGTIYDQTINSHLHFEVGLEKRSYTNYVNPWGDDEAPWLGCMWLDQPICVNPDPAYKRTALLTGTQITLMQGDIEPVEIQAQDIQRILLRGDRIGILDTKGNLWIRDGKYNGQYLTDNLSNWMIVAANVLDFQLTENRIAVLDPDRNLFLRENSLDGDWVHLAEKVAAFSVSNYRIGYLTDSGELFVMEGKLETNWVLVSNNVIAFQVIDNRIAVVDQKGTLYVNEGELFATYEQMASNVIAFQVINVRLGVIDTEHRLLVKEGNLRAEWVPLAEDVQIFQLVDYRIMFRGSDSIFKLKEGDLYQGWSALPNGNWQDVVLNGNVPVFISSH